MAKLSSLKFICLAASGASLWAAPVEQYSRQQTRYVNQLVETRSRQPLPAQDFKRSSASAVFAEGPKTFTLTIYHTEYGDMVYFLSLLKEIAREDAVTSEVRAFRWSEDGTTIERIAMTGVQSSVWLNDGSKKTIYRNSRFAEGAYSISKTSPWGAGGKFTAMDFHNVNEAAGADATIASARHTTFSLPIPINAFRANLPDRLRSFFELFRSLHLLAAELGESLRACVAKCEDLQAQWNKVDLQRDNVWNSLTEPQLTDLRPQKPKPLLPRPGARIVKLPLDRAP